MKYFLLIIYFLLIGCSTKEYVTKVYNTPYATIPTKKPYSINGQMYFPMNSVNIGWSQRGIASWYGPDFHGRYTSNGEIYNMYAYTAAHKTLPMNTIVKVTNLNNNKSVIVRINDRGPFIKGRIIDLSYAAGKKIGLDVTGTAPVIIKVIGFKGKNYVTGFKVQIGAFINKNGAIVLSNRYKNLGYNTAVLKIGRFYKVYITGFKTYNEAKKFMIENKISGFIIGD
ncbi:septal ring lytic transglycosylase RlpA family protein [Caminibacter mediatlanticus TB-2]|uniref:Probable endolytic peptidoglycan transglycosylase RlpA n=1 Tax=Caminibacter mediatlanticus TB-2 TaxID=391592 RepID=A0ABX5V922_9BACT|nr:septal ring lytic transglycosylase RlpA family protein [Caminibacter mediatlanticus]QCT94768.1 septal ring lytic transglycosylase RlpA family protein [Caminibacter mediatlanticus TB-2]